MKKVRILAEIAQGWEGNLRILKELTSSVSETDADCVKFQLVYADELATPDYKYYKLFKSLEMKLIDWKWVFKKLKKKNKKIYFDIYGLKSLKIAKKLGADGVKISTTEFYNYKLIEMSLTNFPEVFISVGGIPISHLKKLMKKILNKYKKKIILLYGFQSEPTKIEDNNLLKMNNLIKKFPSYNFGFMDHSHGGKEEALYLSLLALGQGISVIEKHFTLDRSRKIEDYISGLSYKTFNKFIKIIRKYENAIGNGRLKLSKDEIIYRKKALKIVVANKDIKKNELFSKKNISIKRSSIEPNSKTIFKIEDVIGKKSKLNVPIHKPILKNFL